MTDLRSETHRGFDAVWAEIKGLKQGQDGLRAELKSGISDPRAEIRTNHRWTMSLILINWLSLLAGIFLFAARR